MRIDVCKRSRMEVRCRRLEGILGLMCLTMPLGRRSGSYIG